MAMSMADLATFATGVLADIGAPATASNIQLIENWGANNENTAATFNPLATKEKMPGSIDLPGNSPGDPNKVQQYSSLQQGIEATAKTLLNGYYPDIVAALKAGNGSEANAAGQLTKGLKTWSGQGYVQVAGGQNTSTLSPEQLSDESPEGQEYRQSQGVDTTQATATPSPALDEQSLAAEYGFAASFFQSDPELNTLIQTATAQQWTPQKFEAEFQASKWFQTHSQNARDFIALQTSDPATYNEKLNAKITDLQQTAAGMGAQVDPNTLKQIATNALEFNWDDNQTAQALGTHVSLANPQGQAADNLTAMKQYVGQMGVNMSDQTLNGYLQQMATGTSNMASFQAQVKKLAASAFPAYADQINAGTTVADIADPYIQDMANILELNPSSITLQDPTIRQALTGVGTNGQPAQSGLWNFEKQLRQDPRWNSTENAANASYSMVNTIANAWGLQPT